MRRARASPSRSCASSLIVWHPDPAATGNRLDHHGVVDGSCRADEPLVTLVLAAISRHHRHLRALGDRFRFAFVAETLQHTRGRADEKHPCRIDGAREFGTLREEPVSGMDEVRLRLARGRDHAIDRKIGRLQGRFRCGWRRRLLGQKGGPRRRPSTPPRCACPYAWRCGRCVARSRHGSPTRSVVTSAGPAFRGTRAVPPVPRGSPGSPRSADREIGDLIDVFPFDLSDQALRRVHGFGPPATIASRTRPTAASRSEGSTSRSTSPISCARFASMRDPVTNSAVARAARSSARRREIRRPEDPKSRSPRTRSSHRLTPPRCPRRPRDRRHRRSLRPARGRRGHLEVVERAEHPRERFRVRDVLVERVAGHPAHPLDVRAGAERVALALQHDRAGGAIDASDRGGELRDQCGIECFLRSGRAMVMREIRAPPRSASTVSLIARTLDGRVPRDPGGCLYGGGATSNASHVELSQTKSMWKTRTRSFDR